MGRKLKYDFIFIVVIIAIGLLLSAVLLFTKKDGNQVQIRVDGNIVDTLPLSVDAEYEIKGKSGENLLIIKDNCAYIKNASCPDGLCVKTGKIELAGQSVICLPNRVVVEITGEGDSGTDVIVGGRSQ